MRGVVLRARPCRGAHHESDRAVQREFWREGGAHYGSCHSEPCHTMWANTGSRPNNKRVPPHKMPNLVCGSTRHWLALGCAPRAGTASSMRDECARTLMALETYVCARAAC